jgi:aarF domain-containing kinase
MSGKRILDAIALLNVSKNIAVKHFDIRLGQAKVYSQSSSIAKAIRTKGLPILSTAVSRLASSQSSSKRQKEGILQDHFYRPSAENTAVESTSSGDLNVEQAKAKRAPLPDGTIPPQDSAIGGEDGDGITFNKVPAGETAQHPIESQGAQDLHFQSSTKPNIAGFTPFESLTSDQARKSQRQSEDQIPAQTAETPSAEDTAKEFGVEQEQDVFYQPPDSVTPVLSALPRVRVPKTENDVQEGDSHIEPGPNADVYYHGSKREVDADEPSEELLSRIFHNPRNARMFAQKAQYAPGGVQPGVHPASTRRPRNFHTMTIRHEKTSGTDPESLKQLGADLAKDVQKINVSLLKPRLDDADLIKLTDALGPTTAALPNAGIQSALLTSGPNLRVWWVSSIYGLWGSE